MSGKTRWDYLKAIYVRYQKVSKPFRARILDEFCQICHYNRKYAIRLLNGPAPQKPKTTIVRKGRRLTYGAKMISEPVKKSFIKARQAHVSMRSFFHERTSCVV